MKQRPEVSKYWEDPETVSLVDSNLRALEEALVSQHLDGSLSVLEAGCGGGESTVKFAKLVGQLDCFDNSRLLIERAKSRFLDESLFDIRLAHGDLLEGVPSEFESRAYDVVITQRLIINFLSWDEQKIALQNLASVLRPGGKMILIENSIEGHNNLNRLRGQMGLTDIAIHHWHNRFLSRNEFLEFMAHSFRLESEVHLSLYYLLTRVFANRFANIEGFGSKIRKDSVFDEIDTAARELYELLQSNFTYESANLGPLGPIQGWIFVKKEQAK